MKRVVAIAAGFLIVALAVPNLIVFLGGRGSTTDTREVPHAQAALVLGAQVMPNGAPSSMLSDRIDAAAELYEAGKVDKLLLSGDHGRVNYDEVGTMKRILLARGIPAQDIFTDHAGFDTWDSRAAGASACSTCSPRSWSRRSSTWPARCMTLATPA